MDKNKRLYYIDLLKVIAVFLIINSHCEPVYSIKQLAMGGALGNSLFFICSGFCLKEVIENKVSWLVNKILKLYIPTVIITILFYTNTDMFWANKYIWPTCFWFIGAIMLFYILYILLSRFNVLEHFVAFTGICALVYLLYYILLLDTSKWVIETQGIITKEGAFKLIYYFYIFMLGAYIKKKNICIKGRLKALVSVFLSVFVMYATKYLFIKIPVCMNLQFINQMCVIVFAVSMLLLFKQLNFSENKHVRYIVTKLSKISLEIYLVQFTCIKAASSLTHPLNIFAAYILIILTAVILNIIDMFFYKITERIKCRLGVNV